LSELESETVKFKVSQLW